MHLKKYDGSMPRPLQMQHKLLVSSSLNRHPCTDQASGRMWKADHQDQELEDCTSHVASPLSGQRLCYCAAPQNFLCDLTDILSSCAVTPAACIPMVALEKCMNRHKRKREKECCSLGDFYSIENKVKIFGGSP